MATPTEPSTTYFQAASSDRRVRWWPTRNAVVIVVASTATHMTPRLSASTAKRHGGQEQADQRPRTSRPAGRRAALSGLAVRMPPQVAVRPTAPTTVSMYADSASARSRPAPLLGTLPCSTAVTSEQPADENRHADQRHPPPGPAPRTGSTASPTASSYRHERAEPTRRRPSVTQLRQLGDVGVAELHPHPATQHLEDQHHEQDVQRGPELDHQRNPGRRSGTPRRRCRCRSAGTRPAGRGPDGG